MTAKERVEQELKELNEKRLKLGTFITTHKMTEEESTLLFLQYYIMGQYSNILEQRLAIWREL